jgi:Sulfotransferase domain
VLSPRSEERLKVPVFKQYTSVLARGLRAFVNLEAGLVRDGASLDSRPAHREGESSASRNGSLEETRRQLARRGRNGESVKPENIVWIFGDGRTGSTWLMRMVDELGGQTLWREPMVGLLFGYLYYLWADEKRYQTKHFIFGRYRESWLESIRNFVLDEIKTRFPDLDEGEYLVVKEPNGSIGAPLLVGALPESRMIFLVRDPRDVVASSMDAHREGSWHYKRRNRQESLADEHPDAFVERRAHKYLWYVGNSKRAYDAHRGASVLVRYEDLRSDTLGTMRRIYSSLGIPVDERELSRAVKKHSWENVPEDEKGEGKFYRKATPGGWREDLSPEQIEIVERITAPLLKEFYSYEKPSESLAERLASSRQWMRMLYGP